MSELFLFSQGDKVWRFTDSEKSVEFDSENWEPLPIRRSAVETGPDISRANIQVVLPQSSDLFQVWPGDSPVALTIFRDENLFWRGRVSAAIAAGAEITLECESIFTLLRRPGLRARYSRSCRHPLYGEGCFVEKSGFEEIEEAGTLSGAVYTISHSPPETGWYNGGMLNIGESWWFILRHNDATGDLTLSRRLDASAGWGNNWGNHWDSATVRLYPGCNRTRAQCVERFNNVENYGGFPWIPERNPFQGSII